MDELDPQTVKLPEPPAALMEAISNRFERDRIRTSWRMGWAAATADAYRRGASDQRDADVAALDAVWDPYQTEPWAERARDLVASLPLVEGGA